MKRYQRGRICFGVATQWGYCMYDSHGKGKDYLNYILIVQTQLAVRRYDVLVAVKYKGLCCIVCEGDAFVVILPSPLRTSTITVSNDRRAASFTLERKRTVNLIAFTMRISATTIEKTPSIRPAG